jgi:TonB family protein
MGIELLQGLVEATLATTVATLLVMALRRPAGQAFGAHAAYALWSMVPLALVAVLLPPAVVGDAPLPLVPAMVLDLSALEVGTRRSQDILVQAALAAWMCGALAMLSLQLARQRRFERSLGRLMPLGEGLYRADTTTGLPAATGLLRGRIILPADFESRYAGRERALMLCHERMHLRRGDLQVNALALLLRCLFWFNPLLHAAARRLRQDQELACDQAVVALYPDHRRAYGEAMLKAQLADRPLPLGCHWSGPHPLKERIAMLKQPILSPRRSQLGLVLVAAACAAAAVTAWAAQPHAMSLAEQSGSQALPDNIAGAPPRYPQSAVDQKIGGRVILLVDVAADGSVTDAVVERSEPAGVFDQATLEAAKQWKFSPAIENGKPVAGRVRVPVHFSPDDPPVDAPAGDGEAG